MDRMLLMCSLIAASIAVMPTSARAESPVSRASVELAPAPRPVLEMLKPGTIVSDKAAEGWSHLVLKSQPSLSADERKKVSNLTAGYATLVFTAIAADVQRDSQGGGYRLGRVGFGIGVKVKGKEMIVTPDTEDELGANLSIFASAVVVGVYDKQKLVKFVATTPTAAIADTPAFMPKGDGHAQVTMRYAFLVEPRSGKLETCVWRMDLDARGASEGATGPIEWLKPATLADAAMRVDTREFTFGIPSERAFAVLSIPPGQKQFKWPADLQELAGKDKLTEPEGEQLITALRKLVQNTRTDSYYDRRPIPVDSVEKNR